VTSHPAGAPVIAHAAADLADVLGRPLGPGGPLCLDQTAIDRFCAATGERQWIHSDPERARAELPEGGTLVPGNLLLASLPALLDQLYRVERARKVVLAGYREVRFRAPVAAGTPVALRATVASVVAAPGFVRVETDCTLLRDGTVLALRARMVNLYF
jgi:acyl dehydratase